MTDDLEPPQPPPVYTITHVTISTDSLRAGEEFNINGQISPPPGCNSCPTGGNKTAEPRSHWDRHDKTS